MIELCLSAGGEVIRRGLQILYLYAAISNAAAIKATATSDFFSPSKASCLNLDREPGKANQTKPKTKTLVNQATGEDQDGHRIRFGHLGEMGGLFW